MAETETKGPRNASYHAALLRVPLMPSRMPLRAGHCPPLVVVCRHSAQQEEVRCSAFLHLDARWLQRLETSGPEVVPGSPSPVTKQPFSRPLWCTLRIPCPDPCDQRPLCCLS